jgi:hypothetical protein
MVILQRSICLVLVYLIVHPLLAQENKKQTYFQLYNFSLLVGEHRGIGFETIQGLKFDNNFSLGLGVGFDTYKINSMPLFIDIRKDLNLLKWQPFLFAQGGISNNFYNADYPRKWSWNNMPANKFLTSFYYAIGVGVQTKLLSKLNYVVAFGMSSKQLRFKQYTYWDFFPSPDPISTSHSFIFNRFFLKMGVGLY